MMMKRKQVSFIVRFVIAAVFFIFGITYANTAYFQEFPLFGVPFLAEFAIATAAALVGFYLVPKYFLKTKQWAENLIVSATYNYATDFWNQYTRRMEQARKQRDREKKKKKKKQLKDKLEGGILLDTSMLIDGRILEIAKTGFIYGSIVVPRYVINELHTLSDSKDDLKRKKGRRGLDIVNDLKKETKVTVIGKKSTEDGVDKELVKLAKETKLRLMTLDFNLNKVAKISNVKVLNINELSLALKPDFIPGEKLKIKIVQEGKEKNQGVGYLPDGTMVVVAKAKNRVGDDVDVVVAKLIQTNAGKMVFCELDDGDVEPVKVGKSSKKAKKSS